MASFSSGPSLCSTTLNLCISLRKVLAIWADLLILAPTTTLPWNKVQSHPVSTYLLYYRAIESLTDQPSAPLVENMSFRALSCCKDHPPLSRSPPRNDLTV
eukprot:768466-Hanusia_phi.AAC.2